MVTLRDVLLAQFTACLDENGWFVALKNALAGLSACEAAWKPDGEADNSIWETLSHLNYYNGAYLERFRGVPLEYDKADNEETFEQAEDRSEEKWRAELARFGTVMSGWRDELRRADDDKLLELAPPRCEYPWYAIISSINTHNAHHCGQIVLLRKLQGRWDRTQGVS
ncbi:MAG: DinB family protein [Pyrinomonadaceae bacterium]